MKKYVFASFGLLVLFPTIAFASWWNPFSWFNNWEFVHNVDNKAQVISPVVQQTKAENREVATSTTINETVLCNGQYWNKCPDGQLLVCPTETNVDAYCSIPKIPKIKTPSVAPTNTKSTANVKVSPTPKVVKTFTLPNGAVTDEAGNIISPATIIPLPPPVPTFQTPSPQQQTSVSTGEDKIIGINYYLLKKTCVGLTGTQYSSCIDYAFSPEVQASQQAQQTQNQLLQAQQTQYQAEQQKVTEINQQIKVLQQQIIDIETQYYKDVDAIKSQPISLEFIQGQIQKVTNEANQKINIINLQIEQLKLQY